MSVHRHGDDEPLRAPVNFKTSSALGPHTPIKPEQVAGLAARMATGATDSTGDTVVDMIVRQIGCLSTDQRIKLLNKLADNYPTDTFIAGNEDY